MLKKIDKNPNFLRDVLWSDESVFLTKGHINKQNFRHWAQQNPHWFREDNVQKPPAVMVWAGILNNQIIGPYFFTENVTGHSYREMLRCFFIPKLKEIGAIPKKVVLQLDGHHLTIVS